MKTNFRRQSATIYKIHLQCDNICISILYSNTEWILYKQTQASCLIKILIIINNSTVNLHTSLLLKNLKHLQHKYLGTKIYTKTNVCKLLDRRISRNPAQSHACLPVVGLKAAASRIEFTSASSSSKAVQTSIKMPCHEDNQVQTPSKNVQY